MAALRGSVKDKGQGEAKSAAKSDPYAKRIKSIKRARGYVCKAYLAQRRKELNEDVSEKCVGCEKGATDCKACNYVRRIAIAEKTRAKARVNEEKIKEREREDKELKEKYANEEKINRDKGRVITVEEYRRNKNNNGYSTDAVWEDKSFTAVDEIKQWGKLGEYIYKMIGEEIKFVGADSAETLMKLCKEYQDIWEAPKMPMKTEVKHKIELTDLTTKLAQKHYKIGPKRRRSCANL